MRQYAKYSFLKRQIFSLKVKGALKNCNKIKEYLLSKDYLNNFDSKLNLIISDGFSNEVSNSYLLYKGYYKNGSIKPIRKYTIIDGEIVEHNNVINNDIIIIDLYEKNLYLHSHIRDNQYITGYLIKYEKISETNKTLIFTNEKIKIDIRNINRYDTIQVIDDFVNKFIL